MSGHLQADPFPVPEKFVKFERTLFASGSTPEADEAWGNDLSPPGDGFVLIPNPKDYSLPPGQTTREGEGEIYDISVFHQLHCLNHVRTFLFTLKAGMDYNNTVETYDSLLKHQEDHVYHCFDYIRQALMCNADLTVEWPKTEANGERVAVDGWGVQHQCKNWVSKSLEAPRPHIADIRRRTLFSSSWVNTESRMLGAVTIELHDMYSLSLQRFNIRNSWPPEPYDICERMITLS